MNPRSLLGLAFGLAMVCTATAQKPEATTQITLRAFFNMIDEPAAIAEGFGGTVGKVRTEEQIAQMRLELPSVIVGYWMDIVDALQSELPADKREDVFPPEFRDALKQADTIPLKRALVQPALAQIRDIAAAKARPGETPETRAINVSTPWLDAYWKARDAFARKRSADFVAGTKDEAITVRNERGTFFRGSGGNLIKAAEPGVPEEGAIYCAPFGKNGTWNLYRLINRPSGWIVAEEVARSMVATIGEKKIPGHLASIHSMAENQFVLRLLDGVPHAWLGLNDRKLEAFRNKEGTWEWSSGEPVTFHNWGQIEPNNASTPNNGGDEDGVVMASENAPAKYGRWGDFGDGSRIGYNHRYPFVVEWNVEAPGPIAGAEMLPSFFAQPLPGPAGGEGTFGMRVVYSAEKCDSLDSAREVYLSGQGRVVNAQLPSINLSDPDSPARGALFADPAPFNGHAAGERDVNMAMLCRGRIRVPEAGVYTFGIIHDDGFAFRIKGQRWRRANGLAVINPGDPESLEHWWIAGNGCTLASIELPAGDHDLEFFGFQRDGDCYFQLFSAKGDFGALHETRDWRLIGHRSVGEIGIPGIAAPGWEVTVTPPGKMARFSYEGAQRALERDGVKQERVEPTIDFTDPDDGAVLRLLGNRPFPEGQPGRNENDFAFRARGLLEIPKAGRYWIGYNTARGGRLSIEKQKWKRIILAASKKTVIEDDLLESEVNAAAGDRAVGEIELAQGKYPIEFIGCFSGGPAAAEITASEVNGPELYLKAGEARIVQDLPGLQLVK